MADIVRANFAKECVRQGVFSGANPHYLLGVAQLRSKITADTVGDRVGPFRLTQAEWDLHSTNSAFSLDFLSVDINKPMAQIAVFAVMARLAFDAFESASGRNPSAKELYLKQFPAEASETLSADLKAALDATTALVDPAAEAVLDDDQAEPPKITDPDQPAPDGTAPFALKAKSVAIQEWEFFGKQTSDINGTLITHGHTEAEDGFSQQIGTYWQVGLGLGFDGATGPAWSAAFISFVMKTSGAGNHFNYSAQHSVYISRSIRDFLQHNTAAGYWGRRITEVRPKIGDLICWNRPPNTDVDYDHQKGGDYKGHCDIVVDVAADHVTVIGGNVSQSVTRRPVRLDPNGFVASATINHETIIALMENRISQPVPTS